MRLSIPIALALVAIGVDATCYKSGSPFYSKSQALYHAYRACYGWDEGGRHIKGALENVYFKPSTESKSPATVCVNDSGNGHYIFQFTNLAREGQTLTGGNCWEPLTREINACDKGGESRSGSNYLVR